MKRTRRLSARITPETEARITELGQLWTQVGNLSVGEVITEAVRRAWEAEQKSRKNHNSLDCVRQRGTI
jgi:hypothetical protein